MPGPVQLSGRGGGRARKASAGRVVLGSGETRGLAGVESRVRARVADAVLFAVVLGIGFGIAVWAYSSAPGAGYPWGRRVGPDRLLLIQAALLVPFALQALVGVLGVSRLGQTIGMWTVGIRVVDRRCGQAPSLPRALVRWALPLCSVPACIIANALFPGAVDARHGLFVFLCWWLLVYSSVLWGEHRRGWHDKIANTVVVTNDPPTPSHSPGESTEGARVGGGILSRWALAPSLLAGAGLLAVVGLVAFDYWSGVGRKARAWTAESTGPAYAEVSAGDGHSCAIEHSGAAACWGNNDHGQTDAPNGQFTAISAGGNHTCAIAGDGAAACWGNNYHSQSYARNGQFTAISAGGNHTCAIAGDGAAACWGDNEYGQS